MMQPEVTWKALPEVDAARKLPGWREFHKACGVEKLFFDHPTKQGREFVVVAFTGSGTETRRAAEGRGRTVIEALENSYRAARLKVPAAEPHLDVLMGRTAVEEDDFEALLG